MESVKPKSYVELIRGGNITEAEEAWMTMIEAPEVSLRKLPSYDVVLRELVEKNQPERAVTMAWAAIENLAERFDHKKVLDVAASLAVAAGNADELRVQSVELFRKAYGGADGLEELLTEAGLAGGRPIRRAFRTMQVCIELQEGDYLLDREESVAARVASVDRTSWQFEIEGLDGTEELGAVHLADRYAPVPVDDFHVMRQFDPEGLAERLNADPVRVVADLCKNNGNKMDSDALHSTLVPSPLSEHEWTKWWSKARTALRRTPNFEVEGRSPYFLTYTDTPIALEEGRLKELRRTFDPAAQLDLVDAYFRDCDAQNQEPSAELIQKMRDDLVHRAQKAAGRGAEEAAAYFAVALRLSEQAGMDEGVPEAVSYYESATDLDSALVTIPNDTLTCIAFDTVRRVRPDDWAPLAVELIPKLPAGVCEHLTKQLIDSGLQAKDFDAVVENIMASPIEHFDALMWLWDGPSGADVIPVPNSATLLSRIVRALDDVRRDDTLSKDTLKRIGQRARAVMSARRYERFDACLESLDKGHANALYTTIKQLDSLGRSVHDDLLIRLRKKFPVEKTEETLEPWDREDVLFVSAAGMARKQEEIDYHVNVKMKENAKAIGEAAEKGDLSENSEYKFALEERDLLRARLAQMNAEMSIARVLSPDEVTTDRSGIGTRIHFRRLSDQETYDLAFVGPWDADGEKQRISYQTPLAKKVLGKGIGETVVFEHTGADGEYEIVSIENVQKDLA